MSRRPRTVVPGPVTAWTDLADRMHAIRSDIATLYTDTIITAREGIVSAEPARPIITARTQDSTQRAVDALADLERVVRNEAARLERRIGGIR